MAHEHSHSSFTANLTVGLALGVLAGVAIGLLLAPNPGSHTRRLVKDVIAKGVDRLQELESGQRLQEN